MIYGKAALLRFLGKGLEQLLCNRALFFGKVKPSQCISRSPGLMVCTVLHLAVKWDFGVSMWEKKKKQKKNVNQENIGKDVVYETAFRNNIHGGKKEKRIVP